MNSEHSEAIIAMDRARELKKQTREVCDIHKRPLKRYVDGVWACPDCEADKVISNTVSPHENMF